MTRTYWLSFCDENKPEGQQFLGVCIVDVSSEDAIAAKLDLIVRFPKHLYGAEWVAAASRKAHQLGINPGGQMMAVDITNSPEDRNAPRDRLFSRSELIEMQAVELSNLDRV